MATFIGLLNFTEQGVRNVKDSTKRAAAAKEAAAKAGVTIQTVYWTLGPYDAVVIFEAPDDETATAGMVGLAVQGNVRTQTLRAFSAEEFQSILAKIQG